MTGRTRDPVESASCQGKARLASAPLAWATAKRKRGRVAYRCRFCGAWHVGNRIGRVARQVAEVGDE